MALLRDIAYSAALAASSPIWGLSLLKTGKWRTDWKGRFGHVPPQASRREQRNPGDGAAADPTILIHAVSLGEVNATRQLVQGLHHHYAGRCRLVISATTNTGFARANELYGRQHIVVRYPFDFTRSVRRFLDAIRPDVVALVEMEVWPTFVEECSRRAIPVCVINGRLSERSYKRYRLIAPLMRPTFARLAAVGAQTQQYLNHFVGMGVPATHVQVTDTMKWDTAQIADPSQVMGADALAAAMGIDRGKPIIVAGSTGPGEEELLARTCPPDVQLVIAPRKPERFEEVAATLVGPALPAGKSSHATGAPLASSPASADAQWPAQPALPRRSRLPDGSARPCDGTRLFLLDTLGELRKAYALADVVIVGRSFINLYGSDPIEPIALGKPTIIGPRHHDFADIVDAFRAADGIVISGQPMAEATRLLSDRAAATQLAERGRSVILSRQGATQRHVEIIVKLGERVRSEE